MGSESAEEVGRAMHGDHDAFAALIGRSTNKLYSLACLILRDNDRAEELHLQSFSRRTGRTHRTR